MTDEEKEQILAASLEEDGGRLALAIAMEESNENRF